MSLKQATTLATLAVATLAGAAQAQWSTAGNRIYYSAGNVGIGVNNPIFNLDVRGTGQRVISGYNTTQSGNVYGFVGNILSDAGAGVWGFSTAALGTGYGVYGQSHSDKGSGVVGYADANTWRTTTGVYGKSRSTGGIGVLGRAEASTGATKGVNGQVFSPNGYAGYFEGGRNYFQGNVGIGTTSPAWLLDVRGNARLGDGTSAEQDLNFYSASGSWQVGTNNQGNGTNNNQFYIYGNTGGFALTAQSGTGNVGIGTTSPAHKLDVAGNIKLRTGDRLYFGDPSENTDPIYFIRSNNGTNATFLTLNIGDDPSSSIEWFRIQETSAAKTIWFGSDGSAWKPDGGSWSNTSDRRLKRDITDLTGSLDKLLHLRGVHFFYNDPQAPGASEGLKTGFIAQEVEQVFPGWVSEIHGMGDEYEGYKAVTISGFEALTVEALRDLREEKDAQLAERDSTIATIRSERNAQIAELRAENQDLRSRLEQLEAMVERLAAQSR